MKNTAGYVPRAERVATQLSLLYRSSGERAWRAANTKNISRTGILFQGEAHLDAHAPLEMTLEFLCLSPLQLASVASVLWCGTVVRSQHALAGGAASEIAARVSSSRILSNQPKFEV